MNARANEAIARPAVLHYLRYPRLDELYAQECRASAQSLPPGHPIAEFLIFAADRIENLIEDERQDSLADKDRAAEREQERCDRMGQFPVPFL